MIEIIPAIIPKSLSDLKSKLELVQGETPKVQIDVVDGVYAGEESWPYNTDFKEFEEIESGLEGLPLWQDFDFEFDLLIQNTAEETERYLRLGAQGIILHFESFEEREMLEDAISIARDYEVKIGLALKPSTPNKKIYEFLGEVDFIQIMGSDRIGYQGESLDERVYQKIKDLKSEFPNMAVGVDIGVNFETASKLVEAGATRLVAGSAIFNSSDISESISKLKGDL
jgi:ribulose-phosphate 3-epimerase